MPRGSHRETIYDEPVEVMQVIQKIYSIYSKVTDKSVVNYN